MTKNNDTEIYLDVPTNFRTLCVAFFTITALFVTVLLSSQQFANCLDNVFSKIDYDGFCSDQHVKLQ